MIRVGTHCSGLLPDGLTTSTTKSAMYSVDTYYGEALATLDTDTGDAVSFARMHGLLVIKPDAIVSQRSSVVLSWLYRSNFTPVAITPVPFDRHLIRALWRYQWNMATPERKRLTDELLTTGPCLAVLVRDGVDEHGPMPTTVRLTDLKGPSAPADRRPRHLRSTLGLSSPIFSFVHTADEPADIVRELGVLFDDEARSRFVAEAKRATPLAPDVLDRACEVLAAAQGVHTLDPDEVLDRLRSGMGARAQPDDQEPLPAFVSRAGRTPDEVDRQLEAFRSAGVTVDAWDALTLRAAVAHGSLPGLESVIKTSPSDWEPAASVVG